jgi:hypothetical protein
MDKICPEFDRYKTKLEVWVTDEERRAFRKHLERCPDCKEQWTAEVALGELFGESTQPVLSDRFQENLRRRIALEAGSSGRFTRLAMRGYWLATALVSVLILISMGSPDTHANFGLILFLVGCFLFPILLLGRRLRFSLFDLILTTMDPFYEPVGSYRNGQIP